MKMEKICISKKDKFKLQFKTWNSERSLMGNVLKIYNSLEQRKLMQ